MKRYFNTEGACNPKEHYMVKLDDRLVQIRTMLVEKKKYFVINRGRQYGKTTTMKALAKYLGEDYLVLSMDFQKLSARDFENEPTFVRSFIDIVKMAMRKVELEEKENGLELLRDLADIPVQAGLKELFVNLSGLCRKSPKPVVMMIDEVDSASNNQVFIDFLAQLRGYYLEREEVPTFHSVILAGVYDIKNLKLKLRPKSEHQYNSPWNIAAKFKIDMNFSAAEISSMLDEYEADHHTGMDIPEVSAVIYQYTSGYPVLVSAMCKYMDEELPKEADFEGIDGVWTKEGVLRTVKAVLIDDVPLFESMICHLGEYPEMKRMFQAILFEGNEFAYNPDMKEMNLACMFGYAVNKAGKIQIANRIFETRLYNYFLSEEELSCVIGNMAKRDKGYFIQDGRLDMEMVMKKFAEHFDEIYGAENLNFLEKCGRKIFLLYLRPIINGTGNYYIEAQTRDERRTDVIVDYLGEQFIIELKIWHGNEYNERGERQLADYLNYYHKDRGYMLSFNFNKKKETGMKEIRVGDKIIIETVV